MAKVGAKMELLTSKLLSPRWTSDAQNSKGRREHDIVFHVDTGIGWRKREGGGGGGPAQS